MPSNRQQFVDRIKSETGLDVEILTGEEEAKRTMLGIRSGLPQGMTDLLALDIGGGSTEFIWLNRDNRPSCARSISGSYGSPNGCCIMIRRLERRQSRRVSGSGGKRIRLWLPCRDRQDLLSSGQQARSPHWRRWRSSFPPIEPARIHNYRLALETIADLEQQLLSRSKAARVGMPGLEKNREDVIASGAIILRTIMDILGRAGVSGK